MFKCYNSVIINSLLKNGLRVLPLVFAIHAAGQTSFNAGWHVYKIGTQIKNYNYKYDYKDSFRLIPIGSSNTYASPDSMVVMTIDYPLHSKTTNKVVNYLNYKKQVIKSEYYNGDVLTRIINQKYDTQNRVIYYAFEETAASYHNYVRTYRFDSRKTSSGFEETEYCFYNGKPEYTTTHYFDKKHIKYKEVRINDGGKIMHIETYKYDPHGNLREKNTFFPEFGVTKKFKVDDDPIEAKCLKTTPLGKEKLDDANKELFIKKLLYLNKQMLLGNDCPDMECKLTGPWSEIVVKKDKTNNLRTVNVQITEKLLAAAPNNKRR